MTEFSETAADLMAHFQNATPYSQLQQSDDLPDDLAFFVFRYWVFYKLDKDPLFAVEVHQKLVDRGYAPPGWVAAALQALMADLLTGETRKLSSKNFRMRRDHHSAFFDYFVLRNHFDFSAEQVKAAIQAKHSVPDAVWDSFRAKYRDQQLEKRFKQFDFAEHYSTRETRKRFLARFPDNTLPK
jgi:hypothetical protein